MNPNSRFISPTDDFNRAGGEGVLNVNVVSNMNEISNRTTERLFQGVMENPQSSELIISAQSRTRGTPFNFTTDIGGPLYRGRTARLAAAVVPALPNINAANNEVQMYLAYNRLNADGATFAYDTSYRIPMSFTIPIGYYSPAQFENVLAANITNAIRDVLTNPTTIFATEGIIDYRVGSFFQLSTVCVRDAETFRVAINVGASSTTYVPVGGGAAFTVPGFDFSFWFDDSCTFIQRGIHMVPFPAVTSSPSSFTSLVQFPSEASSRIGTIATTAKLIGFPASFYYSRFITVISQNLSLYTFGESRVDRAGGGGGSGKIIGVFATARYNGNASIGPYAGVDVLKSVEAPVLGIRNAQFKLNELIDFLFQDEFGITLDAVFPPDIISGPTLAFNITY